MSTVGTTPLESPRRILSRRRAVRCGAALVILVLAAAAARAAGSALPGQLAMLPAFALAVVLPGIAVVRVAGFDDRLLPSTTLAAVPVLGLAAWIVPLGVALFAGLPLDAPLGLLLVASALALALVERPFPRFGAEQLWMLGAGALTSVLAARWAEPVLQSDGLFHAGRVRKLVDLSHLSFGGISAYRDGAVHAGYAFPLVHAAEAGAVRLAGVDPSAGLLALIPACAFFVPAAAYAAGRVLGGPPAGAAAVAFVLWESVSVAGGVLDSSELPGAVVFRIVVPVGIALLAEAVRRSDDRRIEAAVVACVLVATLAHPTYVMTLLAVLTAVVIARRGSGWRMLVASFLLVGLTLGAIWLAAIHGTPGAAGTRLAPNGFATIDGHPVIRSGEYLVNGRLTVLLTALALPALLAGWRGRYALAGTIGAGGFAVLALPGVPAALAPLIGPHQVGRLQGALPWPEVLAVLLVLLAGAWRRHLIWAAVLLAGVSVGASALGDRAGLAQTVLVTGATVVSVALVLFRVLTGRRTELVVPLVVGWLPIAALTTAMLAGPVVHDGHEVAHTLRRGSSIDAKHPLSAGLIAFMRRHDGPPFPVVLAPLKNGKSDDFTGVAFNLVGLSDVYTVSLPSARTRAEPGNDPGPRRQDTNTFFSPATAPAVQAAILRRYGVRYVVLDVTRTPQAARAAARAPGLRRVYADPPGTKPDRFVVYQVG